ncbi:magnesium-transporting ATPase (P-type) [Salirhabdus euzebyi]|uniref:Magnesium-transporting ATPase (P-type) n=1 Tax=Salirhabdus euzebyi TaxID=394506 RepID=A0A841Q3P9_9BACI|nr:YwiC-like family protein [Salirhabdus euzebyi]MBB6453029.1 magnesium-transporting ATPase (P-type) [Salirhabdus euzebyi]
MKGKLFIPKQHGAWAMLLLPFLLGISASEFHWLHIPLFIAWISLYLATYPFLLLLKKRKVAFYRKWFIRYFAIALLFGLPVLLINPFLFVIAGMMVPFFMINMYFSKKKKDRAFLNDLSAIMAFSLGGAVTYYIAEGVLRSEVWLIWLLSVLFFTGSTFFVKSLIREKKNPAFRWMSWSFHLFVVVLLVGTKDWYLVIAFIPSLIRAIAFYGKNLRPMHTGIIEIVNSIIVLVLVGLHLNL